MKEKRREGRRGKEVAKNYLEDHCVQATVLTV